ncbi:MAG: hypothetical protein M4D80_36720 [Myxococcota bacterium]|nr:hypothetical protein [Myxococcota bacterium]
MLSSAVVSGDAVAAASAVALQHVLDDKPGIQRIGRKRARYVRAGGNAVRDEATLRRIRALAIPPNDVLKTVAAKLGHTVAVNRTLDVEALLAIEPAVIKYLGGLAT